MSMVQGYPKSPAEVATLDPQEFQFVMQLASAAGAYRVPMESPSKFGFSLKDDDGEVEHYQLTDTDLNRFGITVKEHFKNDVTKTAAFLMRFWAFRKVLDLPECAPYVRGEGDYIEVHSSVTETAATHPLNESWDFDVASFFTRVAELYATDPN